MSTDFQYYDESALLERLTHGLKRRPQEVVFLVGAPISSPFLPSVSGVPDVEGVISLIRAEFDDNADQRHAFRSALETPGVSRYQTAFGFLQGRRGPQAASEIVRTAVYLARKPDVAVGGEYQAPKLSDERCRYLDSDLNGWVLSPGVDSLGKLLAGFREQFGKAVLTTNFDPLIEVSIRTAGGSFFKTALYSDGSISNTDGMGCHVIHLHGYWHGSDTLHTPRQLSQPRPRLRDSLTSLLRNKIVVVCAYGGWDDAFTAALMDVVSDETAYPEILWTLKDERSELSEQLSTRLSPGINRGRVNVYTGIDCHKIFPKLYSFWSTDSTATPTPKFVSEYNDDILSDLTDELIVTDGASGHLLEGGDEDHPPKISICVGRDDDIAAIDNSTARVVFVTGLGGQGKSTVAARYFAQKQNDHTGFSLFAWRDCKEESERFENQLALVIEQLSYGKVTGLDLAKLDSASLAGIVLKLIGERKSLFVFDNVDHYVNLQTNQMKGSVDAFITSFLDAKTESRVVFTCRPSIEYKTSSILSCHLEGISLGAAIELFGRRDAPCTTEEIEQAHSITDGHAFWLDLLAGQVVRRVPPVTLSVLMRDIQGGSGPLPTSTLDSIWITLRVREQTVLRAMAETLKPETEEQIADYVRYQLNYNQVSKAFRALRGLNLVVVKVRSDAADLFELHPLVRQFIRSGFKLEQRATFIDAIMTVYRRFITVFRSHLSKRPPFSTLQYWTQAAELDISTGRTEDALAILAEVGYAFSNSAYQREFSRVARLVFDKIAWDCFKGDFKALDQAFLFHVESLAYSGEYQEIEELLAQYKKTIPDPDARFIRYCGVISFVRWVRGDFEDALVWGRKGESLKRQSNVDTKYDIAHQLALAERDAGRPELALLIFLQGRKLEDVLDPTELDPHREGSHYGNIGRCLHFLGQIESALICYRKSAVLIERATGEQVRNQGYARMWIGEIFAAQSQFRIAEAFFQAARMKWEQISPAKSIEAGSMLCEIQSRLNGSKIEPTRAEEICLNWINGRGSAIQ
jgi:tetratricopeptide (TPR) repeat protein